MRAERELRRAVETARYSTTVGSLTDDVSCAQWLNHMKVAFFTRVRSDGVVDGATHELNLLPYDHVNLDRRLVMVVRVARYSRTQDAWQVRYRGFGIRFARTFDPKTGKDVDLPCPSLSGELLGILARYPVILPKVTSSAALAFTNGSQLYQWVHSTEDDDLDGYRRDYYSKYSPLTPRAALTMARLIHHGLVTLSVSESNGGSCMTVKVSTEKGET